MIGYSDLTEFTNFLLPPPILALIYFLLSSSNRFNKFAFWCAVLLLEKWNDAEIWLEEQNIDHPWKGLYEELRTAWQDRIDDMTEAEQWMSKSQEEDGQDTSIEANEDYMFSRGDTRYRRNRGGGGRENKQFSNDMYSLLSYITDGYPTRTMQRPRQLYRYYRKDRVSTI